MRRIALLSDIHGNLDALDAVIADIGVAGVAERYCLGDLIGYGPEPGGVIERIRSAGIPALLGNYDEGVASRRGDCGCYYATPQARADGEASYAFTRGRVDPGDAEWLLALPGRIELEVFGASLLLVHGSPRRINEYLLPDRSDAQLARLAAEACADVVCVGHVHVPYHRSMSAGSDGRATEHPPGTAPGMVHYVSAGSVGKPKDGDARAGWVEIILGDEAEVCAAAPDDSAVAVVGRTDVWLGAASHRVTYDIEAVGAKMLAAGLPRTLVDALRQR